MSDEATADGGATTSINLKKTTAGAIERSQSTGNLLPPVGHLERRRPQTETALSTSTDPKDVERRIELERARLQLNREARRGMLQLSMDIEKDIKRAEKEEKEKEKRKAKREEMLETARELSTFLKIDPQTCESAMERMLIEREYQWCVKEGLIKPVDDSTSSDYLSSLSDITARIIAKDINIGRIASGSFISPGPLI